MSKPFLAALVVAGNLLDASPKPKTVPVWPGSGPALELTMPDWKDGKTWVKVGLLIGAAVLVKLSFRKMKDDDHTVDE